jgi:plasmid stabilization system protein ParE
VKLEKQPLLGAEVPEYVDADIRELFEHPYRIMYRVAGQEIQIIGAIHSSRRLPRTPPS